jgi:hypothetical protein
MTSLEFKLRTTAPRQFAHLAHRCMGGAMEQYGIRGGLGERIE